MNVNPEDYDPEELRQMAEERRAPDRREGRRGGGGVPASRHNGSTREDRWSFGGDRSRADDDAEAPVREAGPARHGTPEPRGSGRSRGVAADALRSNQLEQLFLHQSAMVADQMTKPYLGTIPQKYAAERVIFDWLEFLVLKGGFKRTMDALRYYRTIDWITEDVEASLQDYLVGFSDEGTGAHHLDVDDHQLSLLYVARLASMS
jgi:archaellum component FlaD/FlaE